MYPFSPKPLSHPGCHITLNPMCYTLGPCWLSILNIAVSRYHLKNQREKFFFIPILQMGKLRLREIEKLAQGHRASNWRRWIQVSLNTEPPTSTPRLFPTRLMMTPIWQMRKLRPEERSDLLKVVEELDPNPRLHAGLFNLRAPCLLGVPS